MLNRILSAAVAAAAVVAAGMMPADDFISTSSNLSG
jgi:hypothetical protein